MLLSRIFKTHSWPGRGPYQPQRFVPVQAPLPVGDAGTHTWMLSGFAYTITGSPVNNATINVFRTDSNTLIVSTSSDTDGSWSIIVPVGGFNYYVTAYFPNSPDLAGITINTLQAV